MEKSIPHQALGAVKVSFRLIRALTVGAALLGLPTALHGQRPRRTGNSQPPIFTKYFPDHWSLSGSLGIELSRYSIPVGVRTVVTFTTHASIAGVLPKSVLLFRLTTVGPKVIGSMKEAGRKDGTYIGQFGLLESSSGYVRMRVVAEFDRHEMLPIPEPVTQSIDFPLEVLPRGPRTGRPVPALSMTVQPKSISAKTVTKITFKTMISWTIPGFFDEVPAPRRPSSFQLLRLDSSGDNTVIADFRFAGRSHGLPEYIAEVTFNETFPEPIQVRASARFGSAGENTAAVLSPIAAILVHQPGQSSPPGFAVRNVSVEPKEIVVNTPTLVTVTAVVQNPIRLPVRAMLGRILNGKYFVPYEELEESGRHDGTYSARMILKEPSPVEIVFRVDVQLSSGGVADSFETESTPVMLVVRATAR